MSTHTHKTLGFSLVELSIVLVILGLLVGGVLSGRSLIRAAELRNITTEYQQWQTAVNTFKMKYNALPGDFNKARDFWGGAANCGWDANQPISTNGATCNGNGDGFFPMDAGLVAHTATETGWEELVFWQHLSNARLIEGSYNGKRTGNFANDAIAGEAIPISKAGKGAVWIVRRTGGVGADMGTTIFNDVRGKNTFWLRKPGNVTYANQVVLTPEEAWGIDSKIDDGKPGTGGVFTRTGGADANCTRKANGVTGNTDPADANAEYQLDRSTDACTLHFIF